MSMQEPNVSATALILVYDEIVLSHYRLLRELNGIRRSNQAANYLLHLSVPFQNADDTARRELAFRLIQPIQNRCKDLSSPIMKLPGA